jgi:hypothetical protein
MSILEDAPHGGLAEELGGERRIFLLRNAEIERFEDKHRSIYAVWDGFFGRGVHPSTSEVKNILALGLVGAGLADTKARSVIASLTPGDLLKAHHIAQAVIGVAFMPEYSEGDDEADESEKKDHAPTT